MKEIYDLTKKQKTWFMDSSDIEASTDPLVVLIALELPKHRRWQTLESLEELKALAESAEFIVKKEFINKRRAYSASSFIGKGKLEEIKEYCEAQKIRAVIFDDDLSPAQTKNIARKLDDVKVFDRTSIILDIFAKRAVTKEGKLQISLAQLQYMLPRLTRHWTHLVSQEGMASGMAGVKGPGEKQLEMDRRMIRTRIHTIKKELKDVEKYRHTQRKKRKRSSSPVIAVVGYTNAGKSTFFNRLTDAGVSEENKLFATLDPITRRFKLPNNQEIILVDTVGFINKLPHYLVDAFKATLEEVRQADILLHILDVSDDKYLDRDKVVYKVLKELDADNKTIITALNKIDAMENISTLNQIEKEHDLSVSISAKNGDGFDDLFKMIAVQTDKNRLFAKILIPMDKHGLVAKIYRNGNILCRKDSEEGVYIEVEYEKSLEKELQPYFVNK